MHPWIQSVALFDRLNWSGPSLEKHRGKHLFFGFSVGISIGISISISMSISLVFLLVFQLVFPLVFHIGVCERHVDPMFCQTHVFSDL